MVTKGNVLETKESCELHSRSVYRCGQTEYSHAKRIGCSQEDVLICQAKGSAVLPLGPWRDVGWLIMFSMFSMFSSRWWLSPLQTFTCTCVRDPLNRFRCYLRGGCLRRGHCKLFKLCDPLNRFRFFLPCGCTRTVRSVVSIGIAHSRIFFSVQHVVANVPGRPTAITRNWT